MKKNFSAAFMFFLVSKTINFTLAI